MIAKQLRNSILQMAVQGKLIPQNPNDEPASVLLEKIRVEKKRLIKEGKIKKDKQESVIFRGSDNLFYEKFSDGKTKCIDDEIPFKIPKNWMWTRLETIICINPRNKLDDNLDVSFVPMVLIDDGYQNKHMSETKKWKDVKSGFTHFADGDIAVAKITPCFENRKSVVLKDLKNGFGAGTTELHILRVIENFLETEYLFWFCKTPLFIENGVKTYTGTAGQQRVGVQYISRCLFPLPPLAEQKRIVERVEKLLRHVSEYEKAKQKLISTLQQFQKSILQNAIQGKLVPQDPLDEPASVLLEKIRAEKKRLIKEGKIRKDKQESVIFRGSDNLFYEKFSDGKTKCINDEIPFDIPESWVWARLENVSEKIHYGFTTSALNNGNAKLLRITDIQNKTVNWESMPYCEITEQEFETYGLHERDITIARTGGTIGKSYIVRSLSEKAVFASYLIRLVPLACTNEEYLKLFLETPLYWKQLQSYSMGTGQPNVNGSSLKSLVLPLPPLAEQKRIVEKVEKLMSLAQQIDK